MNGILSGFAPPSCGQALDVPDRSGFARAVPTRVPLTKLPFKHWKTLTLGVRDSVEKYLRLLGTTGHNVGDGARAIAGNVAISPYKMQIYLANVSVGELGFEEPTSYERVCERGVACGLRLCPAELGFVLRRWYHEPKSGSGEWLVLAMQTIAGADGLKRAFFLEHNHDGRWLRASHVRPELSFAPPARFVFALPN